MSFANPANLEEALSLLSAEDWSVLSGGTDFYPTLGDKKPSGNILDISRLAELRRISNEKDYWHFGALATWTDVINADLPPAFDALKLAAREVGSIQIQNRATVAGNICNASPAADGIPPLLCLDAIMQLSSQSETHNIPLADFVTGNRKTLLRADELVTGILIPKASAEGKSTFIKLGARRYLVISISMVAVSLHCKEGQVANAAVSVGSCSAVAVRLPGLEATFVGQACSPALVDVPERAHFDHLSPIDDVRATGTYRIDASIELTRRAIADLVAVE